MEDHPLPLEQVILGDCVDVLSHFPENSIDLIFADPPYNLQLKNELFRPNNTRVSAVTDPWDQFPSLAHYDEFTRNWVTVCKRVLKPNGSLWVIGSYHNIYRVGSILQDFGFWILNDVIWIKTNPMPNFRGVRFTNAHETLIWAAKSPDARYHFDHHAMKSLNENLQMRSDWLLSTCNGSERIKIDGKKAHSTQKPEALLYRIILSSSKPGDIILDPFFGTGTTGAVAKKLHRHWIGIEQNHDYVEIAMKRISEVEVSPFDAKIFAALSDRQNKPRIRFGALLEAGLLLPGQQLYFKRQPTANAIIKPDGTLVGDGFQGTIHQCAKLLSNGSPSNGWDHWFYKTLNDELRPIDDLRQQLANKEGHHGKA